LYFIGLLNIRPTAVETEEKGTYCMVWDAMNDAVWTSSLADVALFLFISLAWHVIMFEYMGNQEFL
jgi:hypothetical protein